MLRRYPAGPDDENFGYIGDAFYDEYAFEWPNSGSAWMLDEGPCGPLGGWRDAARPGSLYGDLQQGEAQRRAALFDAMRGTLEEATAGLSPQEQDAAMAEMNRLISAVQNVATGDFRLLDDRAAWAAAVQEAFGEAATDAFLGLLVVRLFDLS